MKLFTNYRFSGPKPVEKSLKRSSNDSWSLINLVALSRLTGVKMWKCEVHTFGKILQSTQQSIERRSTVFSFSFNVICNKARGTLKRIISRSLLCNEIHCQSTRALNWKKRKMENCFASNRGKPRPPSTVYALPKRVKIAAAAPRSRFLWSFLNLEVLRWSKTFPINLLNFRGINF